MKSIRNALILGLPQCHKQFMVSGNSRHPHRIPDWRHPRWRSHSCMAAEGWAERKLPQEAHSIGGWTWRKEIHRRCKASYPSTPRSSQQRVLQFCRHPRRQPRQTILQWNIHPKVAPTMTKPIQQLSTYGASSAPSAQTSSSTFVLAATLRASKWANAPAVSTRH